MNVNKVPNQYANAARGAFTVATGTVNADGCASASRPECHAPSGVRVNDYSAKVNARGYSPRDVQRDKILAFWESQGWARWQSGGAGGGGKWLARDVLSGSDEWLPLSGQGEDTQHDVIVFSHVIPAEHGGAWCACNIIPEVGARNHLRGAQSVSLSRNVKRQMSTWPAYWFANYARAASVERMGAQTDVLIAMASTY